MNWSYISGFFDADGCITFVRASKNQNKTIQISFSNNDLNILTEIQTFIYDNLKVKGFICTKRYKDFINYDLKYIHLTKTIPLLKHLNSKHSKKRFKINLALTELPYITPRNGKYTEEQLAKRLKFEERFFS